jgi:ATP-dependent DNA ligase
MISNFVEVIKACENAGGAGTKKEIQAALKTADLHAQRLIKEALDPYRVFGIRQYVMPKEYMASSSEDAYQSFYKLLDLLASRKLTGNAAKSAASMALSLFTEDEAHYISRVLDKDLKSGFSAETCRKLFPNLIPAFEVMLADKCDEVEDFEKYITFPASAEYKLDGTRIICMVKSGTVAYYSRSGKEAFHAAGLFDDELQRIHAAEGDFILDGELYASNFTETMNSKKSDNVCKGKSENSRLLFNAS